MNKWKNYKILAFLMAVLMVLPLIPAVDLTVFAEGESTSDAYAQNIDRKALFNIEHFINFAVVADPTVVNDDYTNGAWDTFNYLNYYDGGTDPTTAQYDFDPYFTMTIVDCYHNPTTLGIWYKVEAAEGHTAPALLQANPWVFFNYSDMVEDSEYNPDVDSSLIIMDGVNTLYNAAGTPVTSITLPQYSKPVFTAASDLGGTVSYQWQIEYETGKWVDIYGEDSATIKLSYGMVSSLLEGGNVVNIRCESTSGSKIAYSPVIPLTVEMYIPTEPDVVVTKSLTTSTGQTVKVTVAGNMPEDSSVNIEETDSSGVVVGSNETVVASLDISIKNSDGTEWQPASGETVTVTLNASALGLSNGDTFVVYHLHEGVLSVLGTYTVTNDTVTFVVSGFSKFVFARTTATGGSTGGSSGGTTQPTTPSYSADVGKHAVLYPRDDIWYFSALDCVPEAGLDTMSFTASEFSSNTVFSIDAYKLVYETYGIENEEGELIGSKDMIALWYQVSIVSGPAVDGFENGYWILQNYISEGDAYVYDSLVLFDADDTVPPADTTAPEETTTAPEETTTAPDETTTAPEETTTPPEETTTPPEETTTPEETEPALPTCKVTIDGEPVYSVTVSPAVKVSVTANADFVDAAVSYQWQVYVPKVAMWVAVAGATSQTCTINYGMAVGVVDANGVALVRCVATAGSESIASDPITVYVAETYSLRSYARSTATSDVMPLADDTTSTTSKYNFIVKYYLRDTTEEIYQQFTAEFAPGETRKLQISIPEKVGYSAYWIDAETGEATLITDYSMEYTYTFNGTADVVYEVRYTPNEIDYVVKHYYQNIYDDEYAEPVTETKTGTADTVVGDVHKNTDGFYNIPYIHPTIAPDGSTVIEIYYDRYYYLMTFDLGEDGYGVEPEYARYGTEITLGTPERPGYIFNGWEYENGTDITTTTVTMPANDVNIVAKWTAGTASYTIVYWKENADPEADGTYGYTYWTHRVVDAVPGEKVSGHDDVAAYVADEQYFTFNEARTDKDVIVKGNGSTVVNVYYTRNTYTIYFYGGNECKIPEHTHGTNCNSYLICGKTEHTHTDECGEAIIGCGITEHTAHTSDCVDHVEHTAHTAECLTCAIPTSHTHSSSCCTITEHEHSDSCCEYGGLQWYHWGHDDDCCTQGLSEHSHSDGDCTCSLPTSHTHSETAGCYKDTVHTHDDSCYKDALHTHSDDCYTYPECTGSAAHTHTDACYSECTLIEHTHGNNCPEDDDDQKVFLVVQAKYDADISSVWETAPVKTEWLDNGWVFRSSITGKYYSFLEKMPGYNINMYATEWSGSTYTWYYYLEVLPGQDTTGLETKSDGGKTYYKYHTTTVKGNRLSLTYEEDYFPITGFDQRDDKVPSFSNNVAYLYYVRNSYTLSFNSAGKDLTDKGGEFLYQADISDQYFVPDYPENFEANAYTFAGWYTTPDCFDGTEFDFTDATMPAEDVALFAKWVPVTHTVKIYLDNTLNTQIGATQLVPHNDYAGKPANDPTNGGLEFLGWFYINDAGEEKAFSFATQIKRDMNIYAKWRDTSIINYVINYIGIDSDGNEFQIASPTKGQQYADKTMTFEPKGTDQYFAQYQDDGYFAMTANHSIVMGEAACQTGSENCTYDPETKTHTFTFYYELGPVVPYTVHYYYEGTTDEVFPSEEFKENRKSVVVAYAKGMVGYKADEVQKSLVVIKGQTNEIIFYYSKDENATYYEVIHHLMDKDGKELTNHTLAYNANINEVVEESSATVAPLDFGGFDFAPDYAGTLRTGTATKDPILQLHLYYVEEQVTLKYEVVGGETGGGTVDPGSETLGASYGVATGSTATPKTGYKFVGWYSHWDCTDDQLLSTDLHYTPTKANTELWVNGTTYYAKFEELDVVIYYQAVGPEGAENFGKVSITEETVKAVTGTANGATADPNDPTFKFVGWYNNKECTGDPISTDLEYVPQKPGDLWVTTTYYAKFEYNLTSLTIKKTGDYDSYSTIDPNQTFMFTLVGDDGVNLTVTIHGNDSVTIDGLTVGNKYTVTEITSWSWRYKCDLGVYTSDTSGTSSFIKDTATVVIEALGVSNNVVTFKNSREQPYWLDGDSWCDNRFVNAIK